MPVIGFFKPSDADVNLVKLFLSPIIFYITSSILKDHFKGKLDYSKKQEKDEKNLEVKMASPKISKMISQKDIKEKLLTS